ncbi:MAG: type II toxin-antitoxin system RelB/DinJ family antitoxin [Oscillospiraceae bacterium]|nr:type II toxin-antitoxin system RelB/DinJ family antitoxin [Oscillospiraceae bacterium]
MSMQNMNTVNAPKTSSFQMRINPEIKSQAESIFATYGLSLTDAVNIFIQQSLNVKGLPFLLSPENAEYMKAKSVQRLISEIQSGWDSVKSESDWVSEEDAYKLLEADV